MHKSSSRNPHHILSVYACACITVHCTREVPLLLQIHPTQPQKRLAKGIPTCPHHIQTHIHHSVSRNACSMYHQTQPDQPTHPNQTLSHQIQAKLLTLPSPSSQPSLSCPDNNTNPQRPRLAYTTRQTRPSVFPNQSILAYFRAPGSSQ